MNRAVALQNSGARWEKAKSSLASLPPLDRLKTALKILIPPPIYMRHRYNIGEDRPVWPSYLQRWRGQTREVLDWVHSRRATSKKIER
jgi:hypothetical protein